MALIVQKYGGSSVATPELILNAAKRIIKTKKEKNTEMVVVVSAMGKTTDGFIELAHKINKNPNEREMDMLLSCGENISISLLSMAIHSLGEASISLTGHQVGIITDNIHSSARIREINTDKIWKYLDDNKIVIVAGFQGISFEDEITTLGRGGSDTSAVALAAALGADICEILTDVDGVYTADPNMVSGTRKITRCSYDEILEMAFMGAKVLHPRSVEIARQYKIPVHVRSSFNEEPGTIIEEAKGMYIEKTIIRGIAHNKNIIKVSIVAVPDKPGVAAKIFNCLGEKNIHAALIVQAQSHKGKTDVTFAINSKDIDVVRSVIDPIAKEIKAEDVIYNEDMATVSIIGEGICNSAKIPGQVFEILASKKINIDEICTSTITITCMIKKDDLKDALAALHEELIEKSALRW